ncbi:MAG: alpha/beta hydrolase [Rubrivivax sp.]|nr:MAG: alpha/beta hydrolase [Rubrivivax sp.]
MPFVPLFYRPAARRGSLLRARVRQAAQLLLALPALWVAGAALAAPPVELTHLHGQAVELRRVPPDALPAAGTIVFENGLRGDLEGWSAVIAGLAPATRQGWALFAYNRPGIGRSEETERPRDGQQVVADLRELLRQHDLKPPFLLVGHSLGGLYQQLFARTYPGEVRGLVLVDAVYPGVIKKPEDFPLYTRMAKRLFMSRMAARETEAIHATGEQVLALPWPAQVSVERLVNVPKSPGAIGVDFGVVNNDAATAARVRAMYPGARTTVLDSDHQIQKANPEAVVRAVIDLIGPAGLAPDVAARLAAGGVSPVSGR